MSRSKEMGKPVDDLTPDELQRERQRCRSTVQAFGDTPAGKGLRKRLVQIEKRIPPEANPKN